MFSQTHQSKLTRCAAMEIYVRRAYRWEILRCCFFQNTHTHTHTHRKNITDVFVCRMSRPFAHYAARTLWRTWPLLSMAPLRALTGRYIVQFSVASFALILNNFFSLYERSLLFCSYYILVCATVVATRRSAQCERCAAKAVVDVDGHTAAAAWRRALASRQNG